MATQESVPFTDPAVNSIPPTLGGNIDIKSLAVGSAFYLLVFVFGALFHVGDPHMPMGNGEVALTALEGSPAADFPPHRSSQGRLPGRAVGGRSPLPARCRPLMPGCRSACPPWTAAGAGAERQ